MKLITKNFVSQRRSGVQQGVVDICVLSEKHFVSLHKKSLSIWSIADEKEVIIKNTSMKGIISISSEIFATYNEYSKDLHIWDLQGNRLKDKLVCSSLITCILKYEESIIVGLEDGSIGLWKYNSNNGVELFCKKHNTAVTKLIVHDDFLISYSKDLSLKIWNLTFKEEIAYSNSFCNVAPKQFLITSNKDLLSIDMNGFLYLTNLIHLDKTKPQEIIPKRFSYYGLWVCEANNNVLLAVDEKEVIVFSIFSESNCQKELIYKEKYRILAFKRISEKYAVSHHIHGKVMLWNLDTLKKIKVNKFFLDFSLEFSKITLCEYGFFISLSDYDRTQLYYYEDFLIK